MKFRLLIIGLILIGFPIYSHAQFTGIHIGIPGDHHTRATSSGGGGIPNHAMTFKGSYMLFKGAYMTFTHS